MFSLRPKPFFIVATCFAVLVAGISLERRDESADRSVVAPPLQQPLSVVAEPDQSGVVKSDLLPVASTAAPAAAARPAAVSQANEAAAGSPKLSKEALVAQWNGLRRDLNWKKPMAEPEMAEFAAWTERYIRTPSQQRGPLMAEGVQLATARRTALAKLIESNPTRALEVAVPVSVRGAMPLEVANLLEADVKGKGDLMVEAGLPAPGVSQEGFRSTRRIAVIGGERYDTYVGERRQGQPSRANIPLHGIAVDGKLAASDWPGRALEPAEVADAKRVLGNDQVCPTSGLETTALSEEAGVDSGGQYKFYCSANHAMQELQQLATDESGQPLGYGFAVEASGYTEGTKRMLVIRVDFPDFPGEVAPTSTLTNMVAQDKALWEEMSYGKTSWAPVGPGGSAITPTLRLPQNSSAYSQLYDIRVAARAAASSAGYTLSDYQFDVVVTGSKPSVGFAGVGYVGAPGCWLSLGYWTRGVSSHELGHNFGLNHANSWDTTDGSIIGAGSSTEYGDYYDTMGTAPEDDKRHYNSRYKNYLGWLLSSDVQNVTTSGTYRIFAHDVQQGTGLRALRIVKNSSTNYWIDARQKFTQADNKWLANGVFVHWTGNGNERANLLDTTPNSAGGKNDAPLVFGRTFSDPQGIHITPIGKGGTSPAESVDVVVNVGTFANNRRPGLTVSASTTTAAINETVTFQAIATDPDNDTLAYYWEFGDGSFVANKASATKSWPSSSEQVVRCTVTDMKGGTASSSVIVRVGNPSTFSVIGKVSDDNGGVEGVTISNGSKSTLTNSDGTYALVGLASGSYTLTATGPGKTYLPIGFANPVVVPPSKGAINFGTAPSTPKMSSLPPLTVNLNTAVGPIPFTVDDKDTPLGALTFSATSDNVALVAGKDVVFGGTGANRTISVTPGTNQTGTVKVTVSCADPDGNTSTQDWLITVNAAPVIAPPVALKVPEDTIPPADLLDAWTMVQDGQTPVSGLLFSVGGAVHGSVSLNPDGHHIQFIPEKDYVGTASFQLSATDQSAEGRLFLHYSFEGPDTLGDGKASDRSNFGRDGALEVVGGGELVYSDGDVPPPTGLYNNTAVTLLENTDLTTNPPSLAAARISRLISPAELDFSNHSWTFACWFERQGSSSDDIIFHIGDGPGTGSSEQLQVVCPANASKVTLQHLASQAAELSSDLDSSVLWHHVAVVFTKTGIGSGKLEFFVDGNKAGEMPGVALSMSQAVPVIFGGHNQSSTRTDRFFNGKLDEIAIWTEALTTSEVARVARVIVPQFSGVTRTAQVNITFTTVNDAPVISEMPSQQINEDGSLILPFTVGDDSTPASSLSVKVKSSNEVLLPTSSLALGGSGTARTVALVPAAESAGTATVTITVGDGVLETTREFQVSVLPVNDAPVISSVASVTLPEDGSAVLLPFEVSDVDNSAAALTVSARSSNEALIPNSNISISGSGGRRAVTVAPVANGNGSATITLEVSDGGLTASTSFTVTVRASNDAPSIAAIANQTTAPGVAVGPLAVAIADAETAPESLILTAKSSNPKLLPDSAIQLGGTGASRTISLNPIAGQTGSVSITLLVSDGVLKSARSFQLVVEGDGNLHILVTGQGSVTAGFIGKSQRVTGQSYTITAQPVTGFAFSGWSGGITSSSAKLTFTMAEELELTANFVPSPFSSLKGQWNGLIEDEAITHAGSGLIGLTVSPTGSFSGSVILGGFKSSVKGLIRADGSTGDLTIVRKGRSNLVLNLQFAGAAGPSRATGSITDGSSHATILAEQSLYTAAKDPVTPQQNVPAAWLGKHTLAISPSSESSVVGSGYATLSVLNTGVVRLSGKLADGSAFSYANALSSTGSLPVYLSLYKGAGSLLGHVQWELKESTDCDGTFQWFKPAGTTFAPAVPGWNGGMPCDASGSAYRSPTSAKNGVPAVPVLPIFTNATVGMPFVAEIGIGQSGTISQGISVAPNGKFTVGASSAVSKVVLNLQASTGLLSGSFVDGSGAKHQVGGVLLQKSSEGRGFHIGTSSAGTFRLVPTE